MHVLDKLNAAQTTDLVCFDVSVGVPPVGVRYMARVLDQLADFFEWSESFTLEI